MIAVEENPSRFACKHSKLLDVIFSGFDLCDDPPSSHERRHNRFARDLCVVQPKASRHTGSTEAVNEGKPVSVVSRS